MIVLEGENAHEELWEYQRLLREKFEKGELTESEYYELAEDAEQLYAIGPGRRERKALDHLNHTGPVRRFGHHVIDNIRHQ